MKNTILKHWLNGKTVEWIAKREGVSLDMVCSNLGMRLKNDRI